MPITFKRAGQEAVALENVSFKGVALDKVTFKRAGHEAVTVFEAGPTGGTLTIHFIDDANINGQVIINDGSPQTISGTQTKVYENVYSFKVQSFLAANITNQTGSMIGVTEQGRRYEINGDGSATIEFYD